MITGDTDVLLFSALSRWKREFLAIATCFATHFQGKPHPQHAKQGLACGCVPNRGLGTRLPRKFSISCPCGAFVPCFEK